VPCQLVKQLPTVQDLGFQGEIGLLEPEDEGTAVQTFWLFKPDDDCTITLQNVCNYLHPAGHNTPADTNLQQYHCDLTSKIDFVTIYSPWSSTLFVRQYQILPSLSYNLKVMTVNEPELLYFMYTS